MLLWWLLIPVGIGLLWVILDFGPRVPVLIRRNDSLRPTGTIGRCESVRIQTPKPARNHVYYRTKDGRADYKFFFEQRSNGGYRIYILSQPGYGSRETDLHSTHRLTDGGRYYVCWDRELRTEEEARQVAALWADSTQKYVRSGRKF